MAPAELQVMAKGPIFVFAGRVPGVQWWTRPYLRHLQPKSTLGTLYMVEVGTIPDVQSKHTNIALKIISVWPVGNLVVL